MKRLLPLIGASLFAAAFLAGCGTTLYTRGRSAAERDLAAGGKEKANDALATAATKGWIDLMEKALKQGAGVSERSSEGLPPLVYAISNDRAQAAKLLIDRGADVSWLEEPTPWYAGQSALAFTEKMGRHALAGVLRDAVRPARRGPGNLDDAAYDRMRAAANMPPEKREPVSDVDRPARRGAERPDDFALVIGIEEYQTLPKAEFGVRDAQTVRRHYEALGVPARNIISLEGSQATGSKLKSYLQQWLPRNVKPESTLFVYYSGHGAPDPSSGEAFLVPWDADPMFLETTAYPLKQFYAELSKLKAKRVLVALDACFSGSGGRSVLAKGARPLVAKVDESVPTAANLTVLAAASGAEITGSLDEQGHGIFTYHFLKALQDGAATPRGLYDYLKPRVQDDARRQNREQSPTLNGTGADAAF